ncbi:hypothetical protein AB0H94_14325 [Streptomyces purpurascens]|uniref:hypothetical protein n=1 Tax=Streptomyces purpurascens TaxID=1924 RepID=UPI0033FA661B
MTTTEEPGTQPRLDGPDEGSSSGRRIWWARVRKPLTPVIAALAALGLASSATGYTLKDDIVPWVGQHMPNAPGPTTYTITSPLRNSHGNPTAIPRCTRVEVKVSGKLPEDTELWVGSILGKRKAVAIALDQEVGSPDLYASDVNVGRMQDVDQSRQLVVLTLSSEQAEWLRGVTDVTPYDIGSSAWPEGAKPVGSVPVRRDSTHTKAC